MSHMCFFINSYKMLQVKIGQLVFYDYEVYVTDPLFPSAEEFSRSENIIVTIV